MIRLARTGKTKKAYFRVIVSEKTKDTHGDYLEVLGHVDPHTEPRQVVLKADRIKHWLSKGAKPSASVHNMLVENEVITGEKIRVWKPKKKEGAESKTEENTPAEAPVS